jgi:hypothetical protein
MNTLSTPMGVNGGVTDKKKSNMNLNTSPNFKDSKLNLLASPNFKNGKLDLNTFLTTAITGK